MSHNEAVSWLQWSVDLILPGLSVGLMSQYSGMLPPVNGLTTVQSVLIFRARWRRWLIYCGRVSCFNRSPLDRCGHNLLPLQPTTHPDYWLIKVKRSWKILTFNFLCRWLFIAVMQVVFCLFYFFHVDCVLFLFVRTRIYLLLQRSAVDKSVL